MEFLNIAFDLDDTLIDFTEALHQSVFDIYGVNFRADNADCWSLQTRYGLTQEQVDRALSHAYTQWITINTIPGARELLQALWDPIGDPITIISARPTDNIAQTHRMIQHKLCENMLYTLAQSGYLRHLEKVPFIRRFKYYVDDNPHVAHVLALKTDVHVFLINKPYNQWVKHDNITRINSIADLLEYPIEKWIS
jgi:hypothetical protein